MIDPEPTSWRIGASMLGAPGEDLSTVLGWLADAGATAVELRVAPGQPVEVDSPPEVRAGVRSRFAEAGIEVLACASYVRVGADLSDEEVVADLVAHLRLAADVGARFLRVFPGAPTRPGPSDRVPVPVDERGVGDARIMARLAAVAGAARELGVRPVLRPTTRTRGARTSPASCTSWTTGLRGTPWARSGTWSTRSAPASTRSAPGTRSGPDSSTTAGSCSSRTSPRPRTRRRC